MSVGLTFEKDRAQADITVGAGGIETDEGLKTAIIISLFTWRRAEDNDEPTLAGDERFGWWADIYDEDGMPIGSRLWIVRRMKSIDEALVLGKQYAEEALQWLLDTGVVAELKVTTERKAPNIYALAVGIVRPNGDPWSEVWEETING